MPPSSLSLGGDFRGQRHSFGEWGLFFYPSPSWFKGCNYLLLGEAVNWIKVEGLGWADHPPPPHLTRSPLSPSLPPPSHHLVGHTLITCGKPDLDSASAFMASCWKKWNFTTEGASMPVVSVRVVCFIWPHSSRNTITYVISVSRLSLTGLGSLANCLPYTFWPSQYCSSLHCWWAPEV